MSAVGYALGADGVGEITLARPERHNAVDAELIAGLHDALGAARDDGATALLLSGAGPSFCSGHDLGAPPPASAAELRRNVDLLQDVSRILRATVPSVAAVHGYAIGAGCELALSCDLVVAARDATFGLPEVPLGLAIGGGSSAQLVHTVGPLRARELVLLGERFGAARACELGLVTTVVPSEQLADHARGLARTLALQPPQALAAAKAVLQAVVEQPMETAYALETDAMVAAISSQEAATAAAAFKERR
jgi:2-(1,2-epoxy-1,2-dihydrophenyl)acetyl-CoA isomerase